MNASLPMYDFPEVRNATDALWQGLARHFRREGIPEVPQKLLHDRSVHSLWSDTKLFISQCCGYDVVHRHEIRLQVLATPWFDAPGCVRSNYASVIVVPEDSPHRNIADMFGTVAVINGPESHSGANALFGSITPYARDGRFFSEVKISGSHVASLAALRTGDADVASIDCVTLELLRRYRPAAIEGTRLLGLTDLAPAPPYVTRSGIGNKNATRMRNALLAAFSDASIVGALRTLLLVNIEVAYNESYQTIGTEFRHDLRVV